MATPVQPARSLVPTNVPLNLGLCLSVFPTRTVELMSVDSLAKTSKFPIVIDMLSFSPKIDTFSIFPLSWLKYM
jgi:hypothetical protein